MNEDYVSSEVAKLLKEKGFDWKCRAYYDYNSKVLSYLNDISNTYDVYAAPTLYMAQKWLRYEKHIIVSISTSMSERYNIMQYTWYAFRENELVDGFKGTESNWAKYNNYEVALQAGISEALKLI